MERGWIKLWRKSLEAGWLKNHRLWAFWTWCLLKASHQDHKQLVGLQEVALSPGQFVFGRTKAAKELGLSEQQIRTSLNFLKRAGNLTIKSTNKFTIITIVNWDIYQNTIQDDQPSDQPITNHQVTTNKNGKNGKNKIIADAKKNGVSRVPPKDTVTPLKNRDPSETKVIPPGDGLVICNRCGRKIRPYNAFDQGCSLCWTLERNRRISALVPG
jgi:hypothetical protein